MARCRGEITLKCEQNTNETDSKQLKNTRKYLKVVRGIFKALIYGIIFTMLIRAFAPAEGFPLVPTDEVNAIESSGDNTLELSELLVPTNLDDLKNVKNLLRACRAQHNRIKKDRLAIRGRRIWSFIKGEFKIYIQFWDNRP